MRVDFRTHEPLERSQCEGCDLAVEPDHIIACRKMLAGCTEGFANDSLDRIAGDGSLCEPFGNDQTKSGTGGWRILREWRSRDNEQSPSGQTLAL